MINILPSWITEASEPWEHDLNNWRTKPLIGYGYIDTLTVLTNAVPNGPLQRAIAHECQDVCTELSESRCDRYRLTANQPTDLGAHLAFRAGRCFQQVHYAIDIPFRSRQEALDATRFLSYWLMLKWRRPAPGRQINFTTYYSNASTWGKRITACYGDRKSKITGQPCAHLELRYAGAVKCKRSGFVEARDVTDIDHNTLWGRSVSFGSINQQKLARELIRQYYAAKPDRTSMQRDDDELSAVLLSRCLRCASARGCSPDANDDRGVGTAQELADLFAPSVHRRGPTWFQKRSLIRRVPFSDLVIVVRPSI